MREKAAANVLQCAAGILIILLARSLLLSQDSSASVTSFLSKLDRV